MSTIQARVLSPGKATGPVLLLDEPLSFWGAFDPRSGQIIDVHHPQTGKKLAGRVLVLPASRGSGGTPGGIAEAIRLGTGPAGIILREADINLAVGAMVAGELYGTQCPVLAVEPDDYATLARASRLTISDDGTVTTG